MTTFAVTMGREAELIEAWKQASSAAFEFVPGAIMGQILHDRTNPNRLVAIGVWEDAEAVALWRALPEYTTFTSAAIALCDDIERYTLDVIARASRDVGD